MQFVKLLTCHSDPHNLNIIHIFINTQQIFMFKVSQLNWQKVLHAQIAVAITLSNINSSRSATGCLPNWYKPYSVSLKSGPEQVQYSWWRHQMETFSALLAICAGNSPVPGEFLAQRPVTRSFDVFFDLRLNKRLSKQTWGWWFETLSHPLWSHCNAEIIHVCNHPTLIIILKSYLLELNNVNNVVKCSKGVVKGVRIVIALRMTWVHFQFFAISTSLFSVAC